MAASATTLPACLAPPDSTDSPAAPDTRPSLRVGTSGDYPPFSLAGVGFDVHVAERLAEHLGRRIEWVDFDWPELASDLASNRFDIAMSGITWRPDRAVVGSMSRAVATGGPCVVGDLEAVLDAGRSIAVNRGGILERYARHRFEQQQIRTVDDNQSLPRVLRSGEVAAFVTDNFEVAHFREAGQPVTCEPEVDRKVYWIAPGSATELAREVDVFLDGEEAWLREERLDHFGAEHPRDDSDHLLDLMARRLAFMPAVAGVKAERGLAIEAPEQELRVLDAAGAAARAANLDEPSVRALFRAQIDLAKAVQRRSRTSDIGEHETLDLETKIRPALIALGGRIVDALADALERSDDLPAVTTTPQGAGKGGADSSAIDPAQLTTEDFAPLSPWLEPDEIASLREHILGVTWARSSDR